MAQSLLLSTTYFDPEKDHRPTREELDEVAQRVRSGQEIDWDEQILAKLVAEQDVLDQADSPSWARIVFLLIGLLLLIAVPVALVVAAIVFIRRSF